MQAMADLGRNWVTDRDCKIIERSLELLKRAKAFHAPTRAFYFVRSEYHRRQGNTESAAIDAKRHQDAPAKTAWDYYLPGHTASSRDRQEAIRAFRAALALQPNHYNALFFLAEVFKTDEIDRIPEAIQLFTACIALRPDQSVAAYRNRAGCYQKLGQRKDAEADFTAAIATAKSEVDRNDSYLARRAFYKAVGQQEKARADEEQIIKISEEAVEMIKAKYGPDDVTGIYSLSIRYMQIGRPAKAIPLSDQLFEKRNARLGPEHPDTLQSMVNVANVYRLAGHVEVAIARYERAFAESKSKLGSGHRVTFDSMNGLAKVYAKADRLEDAIQLREQLVTGRKEKTGLHHSETINSMIQLASLYEQTGRMKDAIALHYELMSNRKAKLGADHPDTLNSMSEGIRASWPAARRN
jgi:tetratricopeptide (TPR) repeat protein